MTLLQGILLQIIQIMFVMFVAPLIKGILDRWKEFLQGKQGPSVFQLYRDLRKLFHKEALVPEDAGPLYRISPYIYFAAPLIVTLLIPVLTAFPLFMAFDGDMLAGGFILGLGTFMLLVGATAGASPYGGVGSTRARFVSMAVEPTLIVILFAVSFSTHYTIPFFVNKGLEKLGWSPVHILLIVSFLAVLLAETGRIPVDNPSSHREFSMIDKNREYDYSGPHLALIEWGGSMKYVVLGTILLNVIVSPWGLAGQAGLLPVTLAILLVFTKFLGLNAVIAWIESSIGKLRLLRIPEFLGSAVVIALIAVVLSTLST